MLVPQRKCFSCLNYIAAVFLVFYYFSCSVGIGESVLCATSLYPLKMQTAVAISVSPSLGEVMVFALIFSSQFPLWQDRYVGGLSITEQLLPCRPVTLCIHWTTRDCSPFPQDDEHWNSKWKVPVCRGFTELGWFLNGTVKLSFYKWELLRARKYYSRCYFIHLLTALF